MLRKKLQAVVVLYKQKIADSKSVRSLYEQIQNCPLEISLLIYDNSPAAQPAEDPIANLIPVTYIHDCTNGGLVPAYNQGMRMAEGEGTEWLLLLDQDTLLTAEYFARLSATLQECGDDLNIAACVPHIVVRGKSVAPTWFSLGIHCAMKVSWQGLAVKPITTINSGSAVRVSFLRSLGGFSEEYPLNFADYWFYREVYRHGKAVMVMDCVLEHELSVANRDTFRPVGQYRDILKREGMFYRSSGSPIVVIVFWMRLMLRVVKHYLVFKDKGYSKAALSYIGRELILRSKWEA